MFLEPHIIIYPVLDNNPRISEGLCDTLDWSNSWKMSNYFLKYIQNQFIWIIIFHNCHGAHKGEMTRRRRILQTTNLLKTNEGTDTRNDI